MSLAVATATFTVTAYPTDNRVEISGVDVVQQDPKGDDLIIESINKDWIRVSYPDIGFSFEAPATSWVKTVMYGSNSITGMTRRTSMTSLRNVCLSQ